MQERADTIMKPVVMTALLLVVVAVGWVRSAQDRHAVDRESIAARAEDIGLRAGDPGEYHSRCCRYRGATEHSRDVLCPKCGPARTSRPEEPKFCDAVSARHDIRGLRRPEGIAEACRLA